MAYIRNDDLTYTYSFENLEEQPIQNASQVITIGGKVKSQADSVRLSMETMLRIKQSDLATLTAITEDFTKTMYYLPTRLLWDRTTIEEVEVILKSAPQIQTRAKDGVRVFYIRLSLEEVISV